MIIINTILPIFLLILLGYILKLLKFPDENFWKHLDKFNYFLLFPSLLIYKLSTADIENIEYTLLATILFTFFIGSVILLILNKIINFQNHSFTSIYQGSIRFNTYIFLALVDILFGDPGIVIAAFLLTFSIPLVNILAISVFNYFIPTAKLTLLTFLKSIFTNPLILACIIGGSLNYFDVTLPIILNTTLSLLSGAALPLGLLSVGIGLYLSTIKDLKVELITGSIIKLIILPIIAYLFGTYLNLDPIYLAIIVLFVAVPTAPTSYALARQLGGDLKLISSLISIQTILSLITISVLMQLLGLV